jgi:hypothetical protein
VVSGRSLKIFLTHDYMCGILKSSVLYSNIIVYEGCAKSECTDFLVKCVLDTPEVSSYLLQSMTLGNLHSRSTFFPLIIAVPEVIFH